MEWFLLIVFVLLLVATCVGATWAQYAHESDLPAGSPGSTYTGRRIDTEVGASPNEGITPGRPRSCSTNKPSAGGQ